MKVFISWSGELSNILAEAFRTWLPSTLQTVKPYFTPSDIEKGSRWHTEISKELEESEVGVLFVTRNNIDSAWLLYEAGALSKRLEKSKVCPVVFGLNLSDLPSPLRQFQATEFNKTDFKKLLKTINASTGESKLSESVLGEVFEMWWPRLEEKLLKALDEDQQLGENEPIRSDRDILEELLDLSRLGAKRISHTDSVAPAAVEELITSVITAHNAIQGFTEQQAALTALAGMRVAISHIARRSRRSDELIKMIEKLHELSFEYTAPNEEDIPF